MLEKFRSSVILKLTEHSKILVFISIGRIHVVAIFFWRHAQGGKFTCPVGLYQVRGHINIGNQIKWLSFYHFLIDQLLESQCTVNIQRDLGHILRLNNMSDDWHQHSASFLANITLITFSVFYFQALTNLSKTQVGIFVFIDTFPIVSCHTT